ncbi:MAG: copper amine oxidase N-terminal domain-containing protein, partial [Caldisericia bacterium]|nr:copper amine oxidase N-terminal domain-containing protein [Caldisericia bacterium]
MKLNRQIIVALVLILILGFSGFSHVMADLGPVHVEMNITGERLGASRANTVTAFKIYMRINKNIEVYDWIKIWFPIDEASCEPKDICGEPLMIKGFDESPRFVPNEKHFLKYDNPREKEFGKLYEVHEPYEMETTFYDCKSCNDPVGKCRIVEDPSGLGCWIMGTVLPSLPRNQEDRIIRSHQIEHTTSIGYSPCGDCGQGGVIFVQNEHERSLQINSTASIEAWRQGYNPITFNTSKATGIIPPATPGRYRLRIATEAEPTPVESDSFVLPCSEITKPEFIFQKFTPDDSGDYLLKFNVGEGGALDAGNSLINIKFPNCIDLPNRRVTKKLISVNGTPIQSDSDMIKVDPANNTMTFVSPCNVDNMSEVIIRIKNKVLGNNCDEPFSVFVSTSSEPEMIESTELKKTEIPESMIFIADIKLSDNRTAMPSSYSFTLKPSPICKISSGDNVTIEFPKGTIFPEKIEYNSIKAGIGFVRCSTIESNKLVLQNMNSCEYPSELKIEILKSAGIINTRKIGSYQLKVTAPCSEEVSLSDFFVIAPAPLITALTFKDPGEPDGCNGWYQTPPTIELKCNYSNAKIYYWFDSWENLPILYTGKLESGFGCQKSIIYYYATLGNEKEKINSKVFFIDMIPPRITVTQPLDEWKIYTNKNNYTIKGKRGFTTVPSDKQTTQQVADGISISINYSDYYEIVKPEVFSIDDIDSIKKEWEYKIELSEDITQIIILGKDQACNESVDYYRIFHDTVPPAVKIISPTDNDTFRPYNIVTVEVETESKASVFINGSIASIAKKTKDGRAIFEADIDLDGEDMKIKVEVKDIAGNTTIKEITIFTVEQIRLKLWVNQSKFVVNGKEATPLDPMPTNQSPPLPQELVGNSYMPVRAVFEAMGAEVGWDGDERRVDVRLGNTFLQLWIDNSKAKI